MNWFLRILVAGASLVVLTAEEIHSRVEEDALHLDIGNGARLQFALHEGWLLGLQTAQVDGLMLSDPETVQRPVIAQEFGEVKRMVQAFRFDGVSVEGDRAVITLRAVATRDPAFLPSVFVMNGSPERLEEEGMSPELTALRDAAAEAEAALASVARANPDEAFARAMHELEEALTQMEAVTSEQIDTPDEILAVQNLKRRQRNYLRRMDSVLDGLREPYPEISQHRAEVKAWRDARRTAATKYPVIRRDAYGFPFRRQPNEVNSLEAMKALLQTLSASGEEAGIVRWVITPRTETVGGWPWRGWTQHFELELTEEMRSNHVAVTGTWEPGGSVVGNTIYALRYRGLGGLAQSFTADAQGGAAEAFSTTGVISGSAGGVPLVSPAVAGEGIGGDRSVGLRHRVAASIVQPGRGAGAPFFDFVVNPKGLFAAVPARQGNLRAVTEVMPGDRHLSQTDVEIFARSTEHSTIPMHYLVLTPGKTPFSTAEARTRYQEMDQHVRKAVSEELGFVQYDVLPGVHYMIDHNFGGQMATIARQMDDLAAMGVRRIESHHHGWQNGRERNPGQTYIGGGANDMYDYRPLEKVGEPWKAVTAAAAPHRIPHYVWVTGMCRIGGPLFEYIGTDIERWAFPAPDPESLFRDSSGYTGNVNFNIHNPFTRERLLGRLREARETYGYQGFWADSFQNLFMSQFDWAQGSGDSLQRTWWEIIAEWSREGVSWTSESHAFPGQSCSIEVEGGWSDQTFFLANQVNRAFRAHTFPHAGEPEADVLAFGFMSNRGWAAVDLRAGQMPDRDLPSFKRLADEYAAALPMMRRSVQLPANQGVLWLGYAGDGEGVWFSKTPADVPDGVIATPVLGGDPVFETQTIHTYSVQAENLLEAFGIRRPPLVDERIGTEWEAPAYAWPDWVGGDKEE